MPIGPLQDIYTWIAAFAGLLLLMMAVALAIALLLLVVAYRQLRGLNLPPDADFVTTIRAVPIYLVVALDLLDFSLDFFAAPISWLVLGHLRLNGLRNTATIEALIPFTQLIPTLTIAWLAVRVFGWKGTASAPRALPPDSGS